MMGEYHDRLVKLSANWLKNKHSVVITELVSVRETPDALGFTPYSTTLVECKISRSV